jgi:hypothetical protein
VSERLALAERAVWELLHQRALTMLRDEKTVPREQWEAALLSWKEWAAPTIVLRQRTGSPERPDR